MAEIPFPEMPRTFQQTRTVPEHEVLLVFRSDDHAEKFVDWLEGDGWQRFTQAVSDG